ncbi:MAG: L,D-transpeptidase [Candidatus Parcubacteria bacterium]|nr:L,D-transpeptidase [Candidatus Paceibacterota bacterium]
MNFKISSTLWLVIAATIASLLIGIIIIGLTNINARANQSISQIQSSIKAAKQIDIETKDYNSQLENFLSQKSSPMWLINGFTNQQKLASLNTQIQTQINTKNSEYLDLQFKELASYTQFLELNPNFEAGDAISQIRATLASAKAQNPVSVETIANLKKDLTPQFDALKVSQQALVTKIQADNAREISRVLAEQKSQEDLENKRVLAQKEGDALLKEKTRIAELVKKEKELEVKKIRDAELKRVQEEDEKKQKYIYINLTAQTMQAFEYGKEVYKTSVTTGRDKSPTVKGTYAIYYKETGRYLSGWDDVEKHSYKVWVDYWMPFFEGYGIHDADWRKSFGGDDYKTVGSNGCINTPNEAIEFFWNFSQIGTKVVVE